MIKTCTRCGETKPIEMFSAGKKYKGGRRGTCKACHTAHVTKYYRENPDKRRENYLKQYGSRPSWKRHGVTQEQYDEMVAKYEGACHACQVRPGTQIDHDHKCCDKMFACGSCVRGLLCKQCNTAMGLLQDDQQYIRRLLDYAIVTEQSSVVKLA